MAFFKLQEVRRRVDSSRRRLGFAGDEGTSRWASGQQPNEGGAKREGLGHDLMVGGELLGAARGLRGYFLPLFSEERPIGGESLCENPHQRMCTPSDSDL
ncbi:hypothetical protein ISN44_As01g034790 [Arabidopsis suecica]|uniref:Uncharacterized protein n=1 Tax=Arabidopsis suecica TaxID=45249 RepID=A0A8T2H9C4_ARASU|nr:hypothetical protein ISN44_As01g034790 [Arabidopsis suecica]